MDILGGDSVAQTIMIWADHAASSDQLNAVMCEKNTENRKRLKYAKAPEEISGIMVKTKRAAANSEKVLNAASIASAEARSGRWHDDLISKVMVLSRKYQYLFLTGQSKFGAVLEGSPTIMINNIFQNHLKIISKNASKTPQNHPHKLTLI
ncbi:hypothetical protein B0H17DRAFT_1145302 [Mycena rosella]|uniref:Uncharacterized protein n=1 Tax=Mycena rosella TaxID=1033263 RepID=A0AAD7CS55_MYCRO|nr:hypothetical protein B0H17DRAFT_1145302 [Mycena rosella]